MTYEETIQYLFTRLPMFSRQGVSAYKKDLHNTLRLCKFLGDPHKKLKTIHVAGTNGKGSTSHMIAAVLQTAGYKTGLYTSPHLKDFRERIKLNGEMCSEEFVINFTKKIKPLIEEISPSFFEITVAMAFDYFVQTKTDVAVIEVGLGGRLDSTNVITPEISIITNIGRDHMYLLGDTIEKIAFEKAGIIKRQVPVVVGEWTEATRPVFEQKAAEEEAPITYAMDRYKVVEHRFENEHLQIGVTDLNNKQDKDYELDLPGIYQLKNLLTVLESISTLKKQGWKISDAHIAEGLKHVKSLTGLFGRWQIIGHKPLVVADVAHNEDGIRSITRQVEITEHHNLHLIIGFVKDKEIDRLLALLPKQARYYFTQAAIERALPADTLASAAKNFDLHGNVYPDVNKALKQALAVAARNDLVIICGSVFLVAEVNAI